MGFARLVSQDVRVVAVCVIVVAACVIACVLVCRNRPASILRRDGILHLRGVVPAELCEQARQQVAQLILRPDRETGNIKEAHNRVDLHLPLEGACRRVAQTVWHAHRDAWASHVGDPNPDVTEYSCIVSWPGARGQPWHSDTPYNTKHARMLSVGVALQDVTEEMGPLEAVPGTHRSKKRVPPSKTCRKLCRRMTCGAGDVVAWDSSAVHRGSSNRSTRARAMLIVSFTNAVDGKSCPSGPVYSRLKKYKKENTFKADAL